MIKAEADLIAAGLLLDLKTTTRPSFERETVFQLLGCILLDADDTCHLASAGIFSARYAHLAVWDLQALLNELADQHVSLPAARSEFRNVLLTYRTLRAAHGR